MNVEMGVLLQQLQSSVPEGTAKLRDILKELPVDAFGATLRAIGAIPAQPANHSAEGSAQAKQSRKIEVDNGIGSRETLIHRRVVVPVDDPRLFGAEAQRF